MKLRDIVNKLKGYGYEITISSLCDEYGDGVEALKQEEWYKEHCNCKVTNIYIGMSGHMVPEISIDIEI